jgi:hypothetical protein
MFWLESATEIKFRLNLIRLGNYAILSVVQVSAILCQDLFDRTAQRSRQIRADAETHDEIGPALVQAQERGELEAQSWKFRRAGSIQPQRRRLKGEALRYPPRLNPMTLVVPVGDENCEARRTVDLRPVFVVFRPLPKCQGQEKTGHPRWHGRIAWATRRRRADRASDRQLQKVPPARKIAHMMTTVRDHLSKADTIVVAAIKAGAPMLVNARDLIDRFHGMIRKETEADLEPWIADADTSLLASFASGIRRDLAAVRAAIAEPWSNGQTEGQITKLKLVKRQMYGRGKLDLLQARLIKAA